MNHAISQCTIFDFSVLEDSKFMLQWLDPNPFDTLRKDIQSRFFNYPFQVTLQKFVVSKAPVWLTFLSPEPHQSYEDFRSKVGIAFEFIAHTTLDDNSLREVTGVYTWIARNIIEIDDVRKKSWMDISGQLDEFGSDGLLACRLKTFN